MKAALNSLVPLLIILALGVSIALAEEPPPPPEEPPAHPEEVQPHHDEETSDVTTWGSSYPAGSSNRCCRKAWEDPPKQTPTKCPRGTCHPTGTQTTCNTANGNGRLRAGRCELSATQEHDCFYIAAKSPVKRHKWSCGPVTCKRADGSSGVRCGWVRGTKIAEKAMNDCQGPACP